MENPEQIVLGIAILDNAALAHIRQYVAIPDFNVKAHRLVYQTMLLMADDHREIDAITLVETLRVMGNLQAAGGPAYIAELAMMVPDVRGLAEALVTMKPSAASWYPRDLADDDDYQAELAAMKRQLAPLREEIEHQRAELERLAEQVAERPRPRPSAPVMLKNGRRVLRYGDNNPQHPTINVDGIAIDRGIWPLVHVLNAHVPGCRTVSSCQKWPFANNQAWVRFWLSPPPYAGDADKFVVGVLRRISNALRVAEVRDCHLSLEVHSLPAQSLCTLVCHPAGRDVRRAADAISRIEWSS